MVKNKKPKDPNAPKKNMSSYFIFSNERRPQLSEAQKNASSDGKTSITAISKTISAEWKAMDNETKKSYDEKAKIAKAKYNVEYEAYKKTENYAKYQQVLSEWKLREDALKRSDGSSPNKKKKSKKSPKKPKQPDNMPKRNQSSYFLFSNERRVQIKAENSDKKLTELSKIIAAEWKTMSEAEKKVYADKSAVNKVDYLRRMEEYKKTTEYAQYIAALEEWKKEKKAFEKQSEMGVDSDSEPLKVSMPRKPKDEKCPKRPLTSYFLYAKDVRAATKEEFPNKPITEIAKEISKKWKLLTEEEKRPFEDESKKLKEQYKKDMEEYNGSDAQLAFKAKLEEWKRECDERKSAAKAKAHKKKLKEQEKMELAKKKKKSPKGKGKKKKAQRMVESSDESSSYSDSDSDSESGSSSGSSGSSSGSESDSSSGSSSDSD